MAPSLPVTRCPPPIMHTPLFRLPAYDPCTDRDRDADPHAGARRAAPNDAFAGWFDSSFELRRGLIVTEFADLPAPGDASTPDRRFGLAA